MNVFNPLPVIKRGDVKWYFIESIMEKSSVSINRSPTLMAPDESIGVVEYIDCISGVVYNPATSVLYMKLNNLMIRLQSV